MVIQMKMMIIIDDVLDDNDDYDVLDASVNDDGGFATCHAYTW